jgi:hypothetical protein
LASEGIMEKINQNQMIMEKKNNQGQMHTLNKLNGNVSNGGCGCLRLLTPP